VETRYLGRDPALRLEDQVVKAVRRALAEEGGSLLVFLPGQGEIRRVEERLREAVRDPAVLVAPLYGALEAAEQDRAVDPAPPGRRKVVLATSIAETSLTIEGVRVVIDSGLARVPRYDPGGGLTRLETVRVSQAAADQRRGRAGRTEPGVCYRLWAEPETRALRPYGRPEILESDLSRLALDLALWGARDAAALAFLDPPPAAAMAEARAFLQRIEALGPDGSMTAHGRQIARLPLPPRLAHMVVRGAEHGEADRAALIAAVATERGLGGDDPDLRHRLDRLRRDGAQRARDARVLAQRWARLAGPAAPGAEPIGEGRLLALAYPERIAKARGGRGEFRLANGRGVFLPETDALAREPWLAVGELGGGESRDRILLAAPLDAAAIATDFAHAISEEAVLEPGPGGRLLAKRVLRLGKLVVEERRIERPDPELIRRALLDRFTRDGLAALPDTEALERLRARVGFLRALEPEAWPDLSDAALVERREAWLGPLLDGRADLNLAGGVVAEAVRGLIPWELQRRLEAEAPERYTAPTGTTAAIDYAAEGGPRVEVRVQELFGLAEHPTVARGRAPLTLALLSPARRPVQTTQDLPGFWRGSYAAVRTEMRGRYPRHPWPEDPLSAAPTTRAKPRGT
jgi:ATP-dependent helicase HrpB